MRPAKRAVPTLFRLSVHLTGAPNDAKQCCVPLKRRDTENEMIGQ